MLEVKIEKDEGIGAYLHRLIDEVFAYELTNVDVKVEQFQGLWDEHNQEERGLIDRPVYHKLTIEIDFEEKE